MIVSAPASAVPVIMVGGERFDHALAARTALIRAQDQEPSLGDNPTWLYLRAVADQHYADCFEVAA